MVRKFSSMSSIFSLIARFSSFAFSITSPCAFALYLPSRLFPPASWPWPYLSSYEFLHLPPQLLQPVLTILSTVWMVILRSRLSTFSCWQRFISRIFFDINSSRPMTSCEWRHLLVPRRLEKARDLGGEVGLRWVAANKSVGLELGESWVALRKIIGLEVGEGWVTSHKITGLEESIIEVD